MYDQFGPDGPQGFGGGTGGANYYSTGFDGFSDFGDIGDIFSSFFGGGFGGRSSRKNNNGPVQGADLKYSLDITFEEAVRQIQSHTREYARRQLTWYKKDTEMTWFHPNDTEEIYEHIIHYEKTH